MKTLLVEDNPADARLIREMLKEYAAGTTEVQHVTRLDLALECLRDETFDVVLLDLGLPDSQGMETLTISHKAWGGLPIVVLTGLDDELFALEVMRAGAQDYLVKGHFDTQLLVRTIRYAVKRKQAEEEVRRLNAELEMRVAERTLQFQAANEELQKELVERKLAEEALRESQAKLEAALASMTDAVFISDAEGRLLHFNDAFIKYHRFGSKAECSKSIADCPKTLEAFMADGEPAPTEMWAMPRALRGETVTSTEYTLRRKDSGETWVGSYSFAPIRGQDGAIIGSVVTARDITERKLAEAALLESERLTFQRQQLRALAERLEKAREEERARVARDLHDEIGQILTAVNMDLVWIGRRTTDRKGEVHDRLKDTVKLINDGVQSVRKICAGLRPSILDDLGLAAAIEWQADEFTKRTGIGCRVSLPPSKLDLDGDHKTACFRIFQECLTNISRHAHAGRVDVSLQTQGENLMLVVKDDGQGFREAERTSSLGILGMKERAQVCGGELSIDSAPGEGTAVTLRIPIARSRLTEDDYAHSDRG